MIDGGDWLNGGYEASKRVSLGFVGSLREKGKSVANCREPLYSIL